MTAEVHLLPSQEYYDKVLKCNRMYTYVVLEPHESNWCESQSWMQNQQVVVVCTHVHRERRKKKITAAVGYYLVIWIINCGASISLYLDGWQWRRNGHT